MSLICWLFGHKKTHAAVDARPIYTVAFDPPEPNYGFADVCIRCKKQLSETMYESFCPNCGSSSRREKMNKYIWICNNCNKTYPRENKYEI